MRTRSGTQYSRAQPEVRDPEGINDRERSPVRNNRREMSPESPPLVCDNRWVVEDITDDAMKKQMPNWTIKIRHSSEEIKKFAEMKRPEYWANLEKTKEASSIKPLAAQERGHSSNDQEAPPPLASGDREHRQCEDRDKDNEESQHNAEDSTAGLDDDGRSESTGGMEMKASTSQQHQGHEVLFIDITSDEDFEDNTTVDDTNSMAMITTEDSRKRKLADLVTRGGPSPPKITQRSESGQWIIDRSETLSCGMEVSLQTLVGYTEEISLPTSIVYGINKQVYVTNLSGSCSGKCVYSLFNFEGSGGIRNIQFERIRSEYSGGSAHAVVTFAKPCDAQRALAMGRYTELSDNLSGKPLSTSNGRKKVCYTKVAIIICEPDPTRLIAASFAAMPPSKTFVIVFILLEHLRPSLLSESSPE